MRSLCGPITFAALAALVAGTVLAQTPPPRPSQPSRGLDQPLAKASGNSSDPDDPGEGWLPAPPPFFGEDGNWGERMKIVWCLDRSGSMGAHGGTFPGPDGSPTSGSRWDRAVSETTIALSQLTVEWQFGIVTYSCTSRKFSPVLVDASDGVVASAIAWLNGQRPGGGTGTGPAQVEAFGLADGGIPGTATCWLLSDGSPNCGASGTSGHKALALSANGQGHVLNTVGIGDSGIFAAFLQELASGAGGVYVHID
ncbi:MAG: VWA domain-containing protein [Planctomycetota bacterium]|nr:VWA domain-containing protein [Planctomycetota bacterium]